LIVETLVRGFKYEIKKLLRNLIWSFKSTTTNILSSYMPAVNAPDNLLLAAAWAVEYSSAF